MSEQAPWLAWTKSGPSHKHWSSPTDHATVDGVKTVCGSAVAGDEPVRRIH